MRSFRPSVLLVCFALAAAACQSERAASAEVPGPPGSVPAPVPVPLEARPLGRILEHAANDAQLISFDGVSSIAEGAGALWLLNSFNSASVQSGGFTRMFFRDHAALYTTAADWTAKGRARAWRPSPKSGQLVPLPAGVEDEDHVVRLLGGITAGKLTLFYCVARPRSGRVAEALGVGVASWLPGPGAQHHDVGGDWRFFGRGDPLFGSAVIQADMGVTTGFDYVFGVRGDAATHGVYLARVPHGRTDDRSAYRFLGQRDWSTDVKDAAPLFVGAEGGLSVTWNPHLQAFLAVYSRRRGEALRVVARSADHPEGPWGAETTLLEVKPKSVVEGDRSERGGDVVSGAREHAHLAEDDGRVIFVTVPTAGETTPVLFRVELP